MIEGILIKGPMTEEDVKEFGETMRKVEQKRPHETFLMTVLSELATNKEAMAILNTVFPAIQDVPYDVKQFKKTDIGHEEIAKEANLGATGQYPHGSVGPDDHGELKAAVYVRNQRLFVNFGKPVPWISLTKKEVVAFANGLLQKAREL